MALLARRALIPKVGLLGCFLASHLEFGHGWLGVSAEIAHAPRLAALSCTVLGTVRQGRGSFFLGCAQRVIRMLLAIRAVSFSCFWKFHAINLCELYPISVGYVLV